MQEQKREREETKRMISRVRPAIDVGDQTFYVRSVPDGPEIEILRENMRLRRLDKRNEEMRKEKEERGNVLRTLCRTWYSWLVILTDF